MNNLTIQAQLAIKYAAMRRMCGKYAAMRWAQGVNANISLCRLAVQLDAVQRNNKKGDASC